MGWVCWWGRHMEAGLQVWCHWAKSSSTCWGCGKGYDSALPTTWLSSLHRNALRQRWLTPPAKSAHFALEHCSHLCSAEPPFPALCFCHCNLCISSGATCDCLLGSLDPAPGDKTYFSGKRKGVISLFPALQARKSFFLAVQIVPEQLVGEGKLSVHNPET